MTEKVKAILLSKVKVAKTEDGSERRVTFVASTASEDRDYEHVEISTFRLPLKGGGEVTVGDLPIGGSDQVDIPLLTNHNLYDVESTIGSVRRASFEDGKLIFEAGISSRAYAQDIFTLIEEGHLDNAFSIQYRDFSHNAETNTDVNGEIVEVSLVTRGSNKDAQVLAIKAIKEQTMDETTKAKAEDEKTAATAEARKDEQKETVGETPAEEAVEETTETEEEEKKETEEDSEKEEKEKSMTSHKEIAAAQVRVPSQNDTATKATSDYLKSKQAERDFARTIVENHGQSTATVMKSWENVLKEKGVTGDEILPTRIENVFFKAWEDYTGALSTFRSTSVLTGSVNALTTSDRAQGHKKGNAKTDQALTNVRRDYKAKVIYKKLPIDLQDLLDDTTGELLTFRTEELADRIGDELVRAAIFGDGREKPSDGDPDYRTFDGTRGLFSIKNDIDSSDGEGTFAAAVATKVANDENDTAYDKLVKTLTAVKGGTGKKVAIVPEDFVANVLLTKNDQGQYIFAPGTSLEQLLDCRIFESPYITDSGYDVIAYRSGSYLLPAGNITVRTLFDLTYNQDVMLQERAVAGTLYGRKVAAGYETATA